MPRSRLLVGLLALAVLSMGMSGDCEVDTDCEPTSTEAQAADKLDLTAVGKSSTLTAKLRGKDGIGLPGKTVRFAVLADGAEVYHAEGVTSSDGDAGIDLKQLDLGAMQGVARGDGFRASFAGDGKYCSSSDDADFRVAKAPVGVSVRGL